MKLALSYCTLFENMIVVEALKHRLNRGLPDNLSFFRDSHARQRPSREPEPFQRPPRRTSTFWTRRTESTFDQRSKHFEALWRIWRRCFSIAGRSRTSPSAAPKPTPVVSCTWTFDDDGMSRTLAIDDEPLDDLHSDRFGYSELGTRSPRLDRTCAVVLREIRGEIERRTDSAR